MADYIEESCGNVFADLGYADAEEALLKSRLVQRIAETIERQNLTQVQVTGILGIEQPKITKLMRGQLREFSTEELLRFLTVLDGDG